MVYVPVYEHRLGDDVNVLADYIRSLGGVPVEGSRYFEFEVPLSQIKTTIPHVSKHKLTCTKVGERQDRDINGKMCSIATIRVSRERERTDYDAERDLLRICYSNRS